ncbi:MAG: phosphoribosylanthranilate isomerase [Bryobacterales bacterium]|nr:phosphoribosylanthranilate isomerase [Bryobacterales bacterium]
MPVLVKICGITRLEDALASVEAGADALGFNFFPASPRYVSPEVAGQIVSALPAGIRKVGVFVNPEPEAVARIRKTVGLDTVQLHGDEDPALFTGVDPLWRALRVDAAFRADAIPPWPVEAILLDGPAGVLYGGAGLPFDWAAARGIGCRIVIAGGLDAQNVAEAIRLAQPWGVDSCSRLESAPGIKDHGRIHAFVKAVRDAVHPT